MILACSPGTKSATVEEKVRAAGFRIGGWGGVRGKSLVIDDYDDFWDFGKIADLRQEWSTALESTLHDRTANEVLA